MTKEHTNRRVLSSDDVLCIEDIVKKAHASQLDNCRNIFMAKDNYGASFWVKVSAILLVAGTIIAAFVSEHTKTSIQAVQIDQLRNDFIDKKDADMKYLKQTIRQDSLAFQIILDNLKRLKEKKL